jgi:hypothetical protein
VRWQVCFSKPSFSWANFILLTFCPLWPWTFILLISEFQEARITDVSHHAWPSPSFVLNGPPIILTLMLMDLLWSLFLIMFFPLVSPLFDFLFWLFECHCWIVSFSIGS